MCRSPLRGGRTAGPGRGRGRGLGALLALITGVGRTALAMARERDLPRPLARVGGAHTVPFVAELAVAAVVIVLLLTTDVLTVVGFSSFGVLIYYAVTNAAAFTLDAHPWHAPKWLNVAGLRSAAWSWRSPCRRPRCSAWRRCWPPARRPGRRGAGACRRRR